MRKTIVLLTGLLVLGLVNLAIWQKQQLLAEGDIIYLTLAPVDPRSLMQGDYMALRFQVANQIASSLRSQHPSKGWHQLPTHDGQVVVTLDDKRIASFVRLAKPGATAQSLEPGQHLINYRVRQGRIKLASNAFFFEEGSAAQYQTARYGQFRASSEGEILLNALFDEDLKQL